MEETSRTIAGLVEALIDLAARDDDLRARLRDVAEAILAATNRPEPFRAEPVPVTALPEPEPAADLAPAPREPLPELTLGQTPLGTDLGLRPKPAETRSDAGTGDRTTIEAHCRLKADGMRWAMTRQRRLAEGADYRDEIAPQDRAILDRGRDLECYLWMNTPSFVPPPQAESERGEQIAVALETLADASALARELEPLAESNRSAFEASLNLLAEAQSTLRAALDRVGVSRDADQFAIYKWLIFVTSRDHIYIARHMRLDDPGDPARLPELRARIEALAAASREARKKNKKGKSHLTRLLYHAKLIRQGTGSDHDWTRIAETVDDLLASGVPPSNVEIRDALVPILDALPETEARPPGLRLVVREIDRYLAERTESAHLEPSQPDLPTPEVAEVARLLAGRSLALIGGIPHAGAREALRAAFHLADLIWVETREHESIERFEPVVARPEVAAVILAIRWSSHSFGEVKRFCDRHGKPMVRLPGGYSPNQVAAQIVAQVSGRLEVG